MWLTLLHVSPLSWLAVLEMASGIIVYFPSFVHLVRLWNPHNFHDLILSLPMHMTYMRSNRSRWSIVTIKMHSKRTTSLLCMCVCFSFLQLGSLHFHKCWAPCSAERAIKKWEILEISTSLYSSSFLLPWHSHYWKNFSASLIKKTKVLMLCFPHTPPVLSFFSTLSVFEGQDQDIRVSCAKQFMSQVTT